MLLTDQPVATKEKLRTVRANNQTHAAYPSARATLCGIPLRHTEQLEGRYADVFPSHIECRVAARHMHRIDHSAPLHWFHRQCTATAKRTKKQCQRWSLLGTDRCPLHPR